MMSKPDREQTNGHHALLLLVAVFVTTLSTACSNGKAKDKNDEEAESAAVPVEVQAPRRAGMVAAYSGTAPIEAHEEAEVVAKVGGEVRQIFVEEGDIVKKGDVLARLDGDRLRLEVAEAEATLRKLERDYNRFKELSARGLVAKNTAENAQYDLEALQASYERARLELSYTTIRAPIDGVVSARFIKGSMKSSKAWCWRIKPVKPCIKSGKAPAVRHVLLPKSRAPSGNKLSSMLKWLNRFAACRP